MKIQRTSILTGRTHTLDLPITARQYERFMHGGRVQDIFPDLPAPDREFLLTGITPQEWESQLGGGKDSKYKI